MVERNSAIEESLPKEAADWYRQSSDVYVGGIHLGRNLAVENELTVEILRLLIMINILYSFFNHEIIQGGLAAGAECALRIKEYIQPGESVYQPKLSK